MENQTSYSTQIRANIFQLTHKRKSWQSLISIARNKHQLESNSDLKQQQVVEACLCESSTKSNQKKKTTKIRKKRNIDHIGQLEIDRMQDDNTSSYFVDQHEADTTMLKFNGKKSSYSNRLWLNNACSKGLRSTWFACSLLLATLFVATQLESVNSWRIFEPGTEARHALGSSSIIGNNNMYTSLPINPMINLHNQNQLLTPATLSVAQPSPPVEQPKTAQNNELVNDLNLSKQQIASKPNSDSTSLTSRSSLDSTSQQTTNSRHESGKQQTSESNHAGTSIPNLVGKILDVASLGEQAVANKNSTPFLSSLSEKLTNTSSATSLSQLLKPRKQSTDISTSASSKHITNVEQQIINQHSNMFASHHRLTPTKQRDQKITSALFSPSSSSSSSSFDSRNSPFNSILDTFKSGITSRSSIVKAISDNKLARTLSEVGKSISSNKYVAGAAAASAIAALGLAVSKFLTPYAFSSYSKVGGEPMLGSESMLQPTYMQLQNTDRNVLYTNPADSMFPAASNLVTIRSQQNPQLPSSYGPIQSIGIGSGNNNYNSYDLSQVSNGNDVQQFYQVGNGNLDNAGAGNSNNRVVVTYHTRPPPASSSSSAVVSSQPSSSPGDTVNGYYSNFNGYNNRNQYESNQPAGVHSSNLNEQSSNSSPYFVASQSGNDYQASMNENDISSHQTTSARPFELNSSGSFDNPIIVSAQQTQARNKQQYNNPTLPLANQNSMISSGLAGSPPSSSSQSTTSRRSGPVSLKLDGATRERINNLQRNNKQRWSAPLQSPSVIELSDIDSKALSAIDNNYRSSYSLTNPSLGLPSSSRPSSFVAITAADATKATNNPEHSIVKSSRVKSDAGAEHVHLPSLIGSENHASTSKSTSSQQIRQQQGQSKQQVSYTIIRPKTISVKPEAASPEAAGQLRSDSDGGLRSFTSKAAGTSWSTTATSEQIAANDNHNNQEQGVDNNDGNNNDNQVSSNGGSQIESMPLHRVSRTPSQSSVRQQQVAEVQTTGGNASENSKVSASTSGGDYELTAASENLSNKLLPPPHSTSSGYSGKGLKSNIKVLPAHTPVDSSSLNSSGGDKWQQEVSRKQAATNKQLVVVAHNDRQAMDSAAASVVEDKSTTNDDDLKTTANLIQLSADNSESDSAGDSPASNNGDNNKNVKLIEANSSQTSEPQQQQLEEEEQQQQHESADKLANTGLVIMLPTAHNSGYSSDTSERRATSMKSTGEKVDGDKRDSSQQPSSTTSSENSNNNRNNKSNTNEDISSDTPFGAFLGAGYSLGGQY